MILIPFCSCLGPIHWSPVLSREWRCSWSSAYRRCSNYVWVIDNFIALSDASYIRGLTVTWNVSEWMVDGWMTGWIHTSHKSYNATLYKVVHRGIFDALRDLWDGSIWMNEWMNECMNERTNERMNERTNECSYPVGQHTKNTFM